MSSLDSTHPSEIFKNTKWRIGRRVWQWCSTKTALLLFLLPTATALIASYMVPQAPAHLYTDALRYQDWLSARQIEFKNWTPLLGAIGAFRIRETLWFRALLALLVFILLISLGEQIRLLLEPELVHKPSVFHTSTDTISLTTSFPSLQTTRLVRQMLGPRTLQVEEDGTFYLYADRRAWARASAAVIYLGLLLLAGGMAIQTRGGWRQPEIQVLPYKDVAIGPSEALHIRLVDIQTGIQDGAEQSATIANLQIAGQTILPIQLGVPARHRGYRYLWVSRGGPSVQLSAYRVSDNERALNLYDYAVRPIEAGSLQFSFASGQDPNRQFILSEDKVVGWLRWDDTGDAAGENTPKFHLWLFGENGQELGAETFEAGQDPTILHARIGDIDFRLKIARFIVLDIAHQPAEWVLWVGGALLGLGILGQAIPHTQIWALVLAANEHTVVKVRVQHMGLLKRRGNEQKRVAARLRDALDPTSFDHVAAQQQVRALSPEQGHITHRNDQ